MRNALRDVAGAKTEEEAEKAIGAMETAFEKMLEEKKADSEIKK